MLSFWCYMEKFKSVEQVLDFAIAKEAQAYKFYQQLSDWVKRPAICQVFEDFAEEELKHKTRLQAVKAGEISLETEDIKDLGIADKMEDAQLRPYPNYVDALIVGMKKEKESYKMYTALAAKANTQQLKDMFLKLAGEEANHKLQLEVEYDLETF